MAVALKDARSCTATLPGTTYEIRCAGELACRGANCVPFTFDGTLLQFEHYGNPMRCGADPQS